MIDLYEDETGTMIGSITDADLQLLVDTLEEESSTDQTYYIDSATISLLGDGRATDHLLHLLRAALGPKDGIEVRWSRR